MHIVKESSGGGKSIEEQLQLTRIFRRLAFELPLQRLEHKIEKLREKIESKEGPEKTAPSSKKTKSRSDHENKFDALTQLRDKYLATLQEEVHTGKEGVTNKYEIDATGLLYVYERLGCTLPHGRTQIEELIWEINDNLDGVLSFDEFERSYVRARSDRTGLEPSEIFFLTCFLMFDKQCCGKIALDDAMKVFYLKYGDTMEQEMELHFGKQLDEGAHVITFTEVNCMIGQSFGSTGWILIVAVRQYRDAINKRLAAMIDQHAAVVKNTKFIKRT